MTKILFGCINQTMIRNFIIDCRDLLICIIIFILKIFLFLVILIICSVLTEGHVNPYTIDIALKMLF